MNDLKDGVSLTLIAHPKGSDDEIKEPSEDSIEEIDYEFDGLSIPAIWTTDGVRIRFIDSKKHLDCVCMKIDGNNGECEYIELSELDMRELNSALVELLTR